jgi:hypothetical protein
MVRGRIESTPSEQLVALRQARDHYVALAESLKEHVGAATPQEEQERERDARRIAQAYDKSITNMAAKMVRAGAPVRSHALLNNLGVARPLFAFAVCVLAFAALLYPRLFRAPPMRTAVPAVAARPSGPESLIPASLKPQANPKAISSPRPVQAPRTRRKPGALRPAAVAQPIRPARPAVPAAAQFKKPADDRADGFVAKVLQPDGTFKEEFFPASPR